jgi:hypothetical protein
MAVHPYRTAISAKAGLRSQGPAWLSIAPRNAITMLPYFTTTKRNFL